MGIPIQE